MGNFDAANVIRAAATSNLGVVSLIVLVLAFLAWRFFQRSEDRVKLIAFAMMFLGAAGFVTAVMLAGSGPESATAQEPPRDETSQGAGVRAASAEQAGPSGEIAGAWHDSEGFRYAFEQDGQVFTYRMYRGDERVGSGAGTIVGARLSYRFTDELNGGEGTCEATLAADARTIRGKCTDGSAEWNFSIAR